MVIIGLTGSIGMGKSTAAAMFRRMGVPVYDSDASVHLVLKKGGSAVAPIQAHFPGIVKNGVVDRQALGDQVFRDEESLSCLEEIIHPLIRKVQDGFLKHCAAHRAPLAVLDIPLLFEVKMDARCDASVVVTAPAFIQESRVLARPAMTREKFAGILSRQMPDLEKRRRADFVVPSSRGKIETLRRLSRIARIVQNLKPNHWPPDPFAERIANRRSTYARNRFRHRDHWP